ncbi:hypothetical protein NJB14197_00580 [Mycobacterium montefiorense]|uniref:Uncharacterized protein n=1 Tax=Mycobacterium montefiorense TaxID=154654 RepID=A0AA37PI82_9MYCO|nr:hypothetical protein MmonteBS_17780 [Mycobacterium montefiorense]GKU36647.1 hypothetical protein NJB14191_39930 [Mycobacterium montefiorense]GKU42168.1 hypothetical protein NJB14192_41510 [Mycobacterium montefiorense]GKU45905.1 hypothetical protein NJB14194_25260 [Mycobacterium montefiorense]GKU52903.1 hypothetical protein NJB14195_41440 [Mycobacterium montefiorense]
MAARSAFAIIRDVLPRSANDSDAGSAVAGPRRAERFVARVIFILYTIMYSLRSQNSPVMVVQPEALYEFNDRPGGTRTSSHTAESFADCRILGGMDGLDARWYGFVHLRIGAHARAD